MDVTKRNGEIEPFNKDKFVESLSKSGFSEDEINLAYENVKDSFHEGITTDEIYRKTLEVLKKTEEFEPIVKYSLKRAVMELGPSGFPFEELVSRIYQEKGYKTENGLMIPGKCIEHEVDVVAYNKDELILIEAKFHNDQNTKSDTKVALYVKARFDDLKDSVFEIDGESRVITKFILLTNTGFTNNAKKYAKCTGTFEMISWTYPKRNGLLKMIEDEKIHPITSIPELSKAQKDSLIKLGCIYCKDLKNNNNFLDMIGVKGEKKDKVLKIVDAVCRDDD